MSREAFERGDWQTVIAAHPLESHDPQEWLRYGVALLQTIQPGPDVGKQQQQAALAFVQAQREGASAEQVAKAQRHAVLISLREALALAGVDLPAAMASCAPPLDDVGSAPSVGVQPASPAVKTGPPVTLTVISPRIETLPAVLDSLRAQSVRPARVHLHLSHEPHLLDEGLSSDHPVIQRLEGDGWLQLHWVPNLGPYRKIVPFLNARGYGAEGADASGLFITVDDDTLYPPRFVEYLLRHHERHNFIVAHRGRRMRLAAAGGFLPYPKWHDGLREPRLANLATGQSGVLYRFSDFPADLELEAALALAPTHDDLWLRWLTARQGVPAVILQPNAAAKTQELAFPGASQRPAQEQPSLWQAYNAPDAAAGPGGNNDAAVEAVDAYFRSRGFDLQSRLRQEQEELADFY